MRGIVAPRRRFAFSVNLSWCDKPRQLAQRVVASRDSRRDERVAIWPAFVAISGWLGRGALQIQGSRAPLGEPDHRFRNRRPYLGTTLHGSPTIEIVQRGNLCATPGASRQNESGRNARPPGGLIARRGQTYETRESAEGLRAIDNRRQFVGSMIKLCIPCGGTSTLCWRITGVGTSQG